MKEKKEEKSQPFRERVLQASQLPRDVVMGLPVLYVLGQSELHLENYYACLKILADIFHRCDKEEGKTEGAEDRTSSLHGSFARIRRLCPGKREQRAAAWSALAAGVAFKLGVPALLGRR